jgi:glyceraldehyde-3-phosphate dehydrogenase (NAD(P))
MVDNQAIVIPETIDAVRAAAGRERDAKASINRTNALVGISNDLLTTGHDLSITSLQRNFN